MAGIPLGALAASIVAVMALVIPLYQLIARACWRYGLADLLDPATWWTKWSEVTYEVIDFHDIHAYEVEKRSADAKDATGSTKDPHPTDT